MADNEFERDPTIPKDDVAAKTGTDDQNKRSEWGLRAVVDGPDGLIALFGEYDTIGIHITDNVGGSADKLGLLGHMIYDQSQLIVTPVALRKQALRRHDSREQGGSSLAMQEARMLYPAEANYRIITGNLTDDAGPETPGWTEWYGPSPENPITDQG